MTAGTPTLTEAAAAADASDIVPGPPSGVEVTGRSFAAARWVALASVGNVVLSFGVFLVLARLIGPAEFGMVAIAAVFIDILQIVARCGLPDAVVQRADCDEDFAATAFWVMLAAGSLCAAALIALSGPIAWMFDLPELRPVLCALSAWACTRLLHTDALTAYLATSPGPALWTITLWESEAAMQAFRNTDAHRKAMPLLHGSCDEASLAHGVTEDSTPSSPADAAQLLAGGRTSVVRYPSPAQLARQPWPDGKAPRRGPTLRPR